MIFLSCFIFFGTFEARNLSWTLPLVASEYTILQLVSQFLSFFCSLFFFFFGDLEVSLDFLGRESCLVSFLELDGSCKLLLRSLRLRVSTSLCFSRTSANSLVSFSVCVVAVSIVSLSSPVCSFQQSLLYYAQLLLC